MLRCLHLFPSLLVSGVTMALVRVVAPEASSSVYAGFGGTMLLFQFAIGLLNDIVDIEDDRRAGRAKPLVVLGMPDRVVRTVGGVVVGLLVASGLTVMAALQPPQAWGLGVAGVACGLAYDLWLKRTRWAWLPYALAMPLIPLWVVAGTAGDVRGVGWLLPLGALLGVALYLANQAPDASHDRGAAGRLGERRARLLALSAFVLAVGAATVALVALEAHPLAIAASAASVGTTLVLLRRVPLFGSMAVAAVVVAVSVAASMPR